MRRTWTGMALALFGIFGTAGSASAQGSVESDREALVALYDATDGDNWRCNLLGWTTDAPLDQWDGVTTNSSGRVTGVGVQNCGLSGMLPPELGNLTKLAELGLHRNDLSGPIPPELRGLTSLEVLLLDQNALSGPIPPELSDMTALRILNMAHNNLTGSIPPTLGDLGALSTLILRDNDLSGSIPPELGGLASLAALDLNTNGLSGPIPLELSNLASLRVLGLSPGNEELCAPDDATFLAWLRSLDTLIWAGPRCGGGNVAPTPQPPDVVEWLVGSAVRDHGGLHAGGQPLTMDISVLFTYGLGSGASARDAAGPPGVTFSAASDDQAVAKVTMSGSDLTITPAGMGEVGITVTATDGTTSADAPFSVTVEPTPVPALPLAGVLVLGALSCWLGHRRLAGRR